MRRQTGAHAIDRAKAQATRVEGRRTIDFEDVDLPWREAPARWALLPEVPRRHQLEASWRSVLHTDLNPRLQRWHEALRAQLTPLGATDWLAFWSEQKGLDLSATAKLSDAVLQSTADVYGHGLGIYLNQLELPLDDLWRSDADWAFRAPRFDVVFTESARMPVLIHTFGDLGVELAQQANVRLEYGALPGVRCLRVEIPKEVHVLQRMSGGWQDYARSLRGLGMAQHPAHTDPTLPFWHRWLGDATPTIAYGLLMEGLVHDKAWLETRLEYTASDDFIAIARLTWLYRLRRMAAGADYEQRLWQSEPGTSTAADFEESLTAATRVRHFGDDYLRPLLGAPWSSLHAAAWVRAEVFAAQLRVYLRREFDEEWWRSTRAARFVKDELWRPGRRHTAEELLGFMGFEGFDPAVLATEFEEVLRPL
ncbi:MAG: hypothetical protein LC797_06095 [Chloroflexi bacterium]|nr:hypothetical protein [Chloroflexota bacterium]